MKNYTPSNVSDFVEILFKRRKLFFKPFFIVLAISFAVFPFLPRVYRSSAMVMLEDDKIINPLIEGLAVKTSTEKKVKTLTTQIMSWPNLSSLAKTTGLSDRLKDPTKFDDLLKDMKDRISITSVSEKIVKITYEDRDPQMAWKMTTAIAETMVNTNKQQKQDDAKSAIQFIDDQLRVYKERLQGSEKTFFINKVNTELNDALKKRALLSDQVSRLDKVVVTEVVRAQNPQTLELRKDLLQAESLLAQMESQGQSENNPLVRELRVKVSALRKRLRFMEESQSGSETSSTNPVYQDILHQLKELDLTINSLEKRRADLEQGRLAKTNVTEQDLLAMERDKRVNEDIYQALLMKLENAHISQQLDAHGFNRSLEIIDPARIPLKPAKPDPLKTLAICFVLALGTGLGAVFVSEYFDGSFRGVQDAKDSLAFPLLATLPKMIYELKGVRALIYNRFRKFLEREIYVIRKTNNSDISPLVVAYHDSDSFPVEQFRLLRTQISSQAANRPMKTLLLTSSLRGEGTSTAAVNLAILMAQETNQKVLLMDCDLRNGSVGKLLPLSSKDGLSDYLSGSKQNWDSLVQESVVDRLSVFPSGTLISNPSRLLASDRMVQLMNELKSKYDVIVMDAPPVLNISDIPVLLNYTDGVVFAVQSGVTARQLVREALVAIQGANKSPVLGYVLTDVETHIPSYFRKMFYLGDSSMDSLKGVYREAI